MFPFLGRADFTGLTSCSSFYVIPHGLCPFCSSGKYFSTREKFKHYCSSLWHAVIFSSTKEPLAHLPVCHWQFLPFLFVGLSKPDSQCSSGCNSLSTTGYCTKNTYSEFLSGALDFFRPWVSALSFKPISCMNPNTLESCSLFWSQYVNNHIQNYSKIKFRHISSLNQYIKLPNCLSKGQYTHLKEDYNLKNLL